MVAIYHRVGIRAKAPEVFEALTTTKGLSKWWSEAKGKATQGGTINYGFCKMKVEEAKPNARVKWLCVDGPDSWLKTEILFELKPKEGQIYIIFTHAGWRSPVEFMHHCSTKWATFLLSLKEYLETGAGRPVPYDLKIAKGD